TNREIDAAFAILAKKRADALLIGPDALFTNRCVQLAILAARHALPAIHGNREFAEAGGLMSYGPSVTDLFRLVVIFTRRLPKSQPTYRSSCQASSTSSLTCKRLGHLVSTSHRPCSPALTT